MDKAKTVNGSTSLFVAAYKGHLPVVERLIAAGTDVDKATTDGGSTPSAAVVALLSA